MKAFLVRSVALLVLALAGVELYRLGFVRFNYPDRHRFPVHGIDVSHHQAGIDWPELKGGEVAFAFIKATEGATHKDTRFAENWADAGEAGLARGAYHFFTFCAPGAAQAENFLASVASLEAELPPGVDIEFSGNCESWVSIEAIQSELATFLALVEARLQRQPILYYTSEAADRILAGRFQEHLRWPRSIFGPPRDETVGPWTFWQYADNARVAGIRGLVDLDVFRGTREEFEALVRSRTH